MKKKSVRTAARRVAAAAAPKPTESAPERCPGCARPKDFATALLCDECYLRLSVENRGLLERVLAESGPDSQEYRRVAMQAIASAAAAWPPKRLAELRYTLASGVEETAIVELEPGVTIAAGETLLAKAGPDGSITLARGPEPEA